MAFEKKAILGENTKVEEFSGLKVAITGGGGGIGVACAESFYKAGAHVFLIDIDFSQANPSLLKQERVITHQADITDEGDVCAFFKEHGPIDVLTNCAGIVPVGSVATCSPKDFKKSMDVNVFGTFLMTQAAVRLSLESNRALSIVNIASVISSISTAPDRLAYAAGKAAIIGMTKSVALDFIQDNIRCNAVCPGTINTKSLRDRVTQKSNTAKDYDRVLQAFNDRQPIGRMGTPEEIATLVRFVASSQVGFMTGSVVTADGGFSL